MGKRGEEGKRKRGKEGGGEEGKREEGKKRGKEEGGEEAKRERGKEGRGEEGKVVWLLVVALLFCYIMFIFDQSSHIFDN